MTKKNIVSPGLNTNSFRSCFPMDLFFTYVSTQPRKQGRQSPSVVEGRGRVERGMWYGSKE